MNTVFVADPNVTVAVVVTCVAVFFFIVLAVIVYMRRKRRGIVYVVGRELQKGHLLELRVLYCYSTTFVGLLDIKSDIS